MANLGKKGLEIPKQPTKKGVTGVSPEGQTKDLTGDQKFNLFMASVFGFGLVCLLALLSIVYTSYHDYSKALREYNDKRWDIFDKKINQIEVKIASPSSK